MILSDEIKRINKLLKKFQDGNKSALNTLFDITNSKLTYFAFKYSHNKNIIDDIISETFLNVLKYIRTFDCTKNGLSWLIKIVKNTALRLNRNENIFDDIDNLEISYDESENIENKVLIGEIVLSLNKEDYEYFENYFVYEYSIRQISALSGKSKSTGARKITNLKNKIIEFSKEWDN